jgi:ADP-ribose pyrophosphatase YjhB (NUDIX family)
LKEEVLIVHTVFMMKRNCEQSVAAIVFKNDKREVLLIKRRDVPVWALPGGGIDPGESPEEAAIREVQEETGMQVCIERHVAIYTPVSHLAKITYVFECSPLTGSLQVSSETKDVAFFPLDALPKSFFFVHNDWLEDALKNTSLIQKPLVQVTYLNLFLHFLRHPILVTRAILARLGLPINS